MHDPECIQYGTGRNLLKPDRQILFMSVCSFSSRYLLYKALLLVFLLTGVTGFAQVLSTFTLKIDRPAAGLQVPASLNLDAISFTADSSLSLVDITSGKPVPVPAQVVQGNIRTLNWQVNANGPQTRTYQLLQAAPQKFPEVQAVKTDSCLVLEANGTKLLNYYYQKKNPPAGIDTVYGRSGFIHPLWTPHGQELTRIQAPDHYHHYGIWNPWTHVYFEKDTIDFWNLRDRKGTVRFAKLLSHTDGNVFTEFEALHEHVVFKKDGTEKVALNEIQTVRMYQPPPGSDYYIVDITSKMSCATESPFLILAYRYAGMGWRTTAYWDDNNCEVLTSEGKTRKDTDGTRAKWCIVQGALPGNDAGGIAFLSYPANYNFPEPMRIWGPKTNGRGDMFFSFAPTKDRNWLLQPGNVYVLKYRMVVFNGKFDAAKAEAAWQYFATPPTITINH